MVDFFGTHTLRAAVLPLAVFFLFVVCQHAAAQHNGDPLLYQGLTEQNSVDVNGSALGNAYVSRSNDVNALFHNAAGSANIQSIQLSLASQFRSTMIRDNEQFYPG